MTLAGDDRVESESTTVLYGEIERCVFDEVWRRPSLGHCVGWHPIQCRWDLTSLLIYGRDKVSSET